MECSIKWRGEGVAFSAHTGSGHALDMDGAVEAGGKNQAPRPMELMLAGLGGCTAFDVVTILTKGRHAVSGCEVRVTAERADHDPKVFTRIQLDYTVSGTNLRPEVVERAVALSKEKYCSASIMLAKTAEITHHITITDHID